MSNLVRLPAFTLISGVGWCIDFTIFNMLNVHGFSYFASNLTSASVAVSFVLITARRWIFKNQIGSYQALVGKYVLWNIVAVSIASLLIQLAAKGLEGLDLGWLRQSIAALLGTVPSQRALISNLAKVAITPLTMYANFVATGYIIERRLALY